MGERAYTVSEIDALRSACRDRVIWGTTNSDYMRGMSGSYREADMVKSAEEMVRTYMLAGITADQIYAEDRPTPTRPEEE